MPLQQKKCGNLTRPQTLQVCLHQQDMPIALLCEKGLHLKQEKDKLRVFVSYQILKKMLAEKNVDLDMLKIVTKNNKPEFDFEDVGLYFNISHSGNIVAVALCDRPVGIDVQIEKTPNIKLCERYFGKTKTINILKSKNEGIHSIKSKNIPSFYFWKFNFYSKKYAF